MAFSGNATSKAPVDDAGDIPRKVGASIGIMVLSLLGEKEISHPGKTTHSIHSCLISDDIKTRAETEDSPKYISHSQAFRYR